MLRIISQLAARWSPLFVKHITPSPRRGMRWGLLFLSLPLAAQTVWVEAESMSVKGGWAVDQQFMDQMGSPYLLAHGLGKPVADAQTEVEIPTDATYYIYVRTYNWTSPWTEAAGPGRFQLRVGKTTLKTELGATGNRWMWQQAGQVKLRKGTTTLALHDLTGFDGRCDAIVLTTSPQALPDGGDVLRLMRRQCLGLTAKALPTKTYDLVVVGGGVAGMCAAVSAARMGCRVALVNDRPVLGGNNSAEVRVHLGGYAELGPNVGLGRMIREFGHTRSGNAQTADYYEDVKKDSFVRAEQLVDLYPCYRAVAVEKRGQTVKSVTIVHTETAEELLLRGRWFADCTGDGTVGHLAGADYHVGREARHEYGESLAPEVADSMVMGASVQWRSADCGRKTAFPRFQYGLTFTDASCERVNMGEWTWETGMNLDQVNDAERVRDYGMLVVYSNWSYLKNDLKDNRRFANRDLEWMAYVAGKRESRRLLGDYVLKQDDIDKGMTHEDASFTASWAIDLHFPDTTNARLFPGQEFKASTVHRYIHPCAVPYRCLYSRNVDNLFMAGRNISVTHVALGTVRVMRTTGMMGEVVGMAAGLCKQHAVNPRDIYQHHLSELKALMQKGLGREDVPDNQRFNLPNKLLEHPKALKP